MIDQSLRSIILADSTITSLIASNGVYPQRLPQDVAKPCIIYQMGDGIPQLTAGSTSDLKRYTVDLIVVAEKYSQTREITQALISLFQGLGTTQSGDEVKGCVVHNVFNDFEETLQLYSATLDIVITVKES